MWCERLQKRLRGSFVDNQTVEAPALDDCANGLCLRNGASRGEKAWATWVQLPPKRLDGRNKDLTAEIEDVGTIMSTFHGRRPDDGPRGSFRKPEPQSARLPVDEHLIRPDEG